MFFARKSLTKTDRCAGALPGKRNHLLVLHFSGRFLLTAFLRRRRISMYKYYPHAVIPVNYNSQIRKIFEATTYFKGPFRGSSRRLLSSSSFTIHANFRCTIVDIWIASLKKKKEKIHLAPFTQYGSKWCTVLQTARSSGTKHSVLW